MPVAGTAHATVQQSLLDLDFPVFEYDPQTCTRNATGDTAKPSEVQLCPYEVTWKADRKGRGQVPSTWRWRATFRFDTNVYTVETIGAWIKDSLPIIRHPLAPGHEVTKWRLRVDKTEDHYRPNVNPIHHTKFVMDFTLLSI